jgi:predicted helicase
MSIHAIHKYRQEVERIIHFGGTSKETSIRVAFQNLLNEYAKQKNLILIPEITIKTAAGNNVMPDGTLKDMLRLDWGYWESKDEDDDIDEEIRKKFDKGYPKDNIIFEDSHTAVLIQGGKEKKRVKMSNAESLDKLLHAFVNFERPEVKQFRSAIELFKQDIPKVVLALREIILTEGNTNVEFQKARKRFLKLCQHSINPDVNIEDVREMIIQHILTEDIFNTIFDETQFHRENNIAHELELVINTFFKGEVKRRAFGSISHYYKAINATAAAIADHHEKQNFLKVVYETFYKSYNPKAADRLGVVYTPNEIVKFMIESTDYLLHKHFNKFLEDENVHILDPATGTGTYICDIIDHIRKEKLEYKYKNELHSNEVAILPYYISNLNIEFTYNQKMGKYAEFKNHCFVDTLDNMGFEFRGKQFNLFESFSEENSKRVYQQNQRPISVVIGNPPYNANQQNENDNNKNREYPRIDQRIKDTFIKYSTAQKTKVYDMYARFYRWAFDRLEDDGIVAFITNRSFIDSRTFDGFRKCIQQDFDYAYIIDTKSDVRSNPKIAGTTHNVFGIKTGVAIMFLVKKANRDNATCNIHYIAMDDFWLKEKKLEWFSENTFNGISFEHIRPDSKNNWLNITNNDFDDLLPVADKKVKAGKSNKAIFKLFFTGVPTNRDAWVYDLSEENLKSKMKYFSDRYNKSIDSDILDPSIKWSRDLKKEWERKNKSEFLESHIKNAVYRPYFKTKQYTEKVLVDVLTQNHYDVFGKSLNRQNKVIAIPGVGIDRPYHCLAIDLLPHLQITPNGQCLPLSIYNANGQLEDNITDWSLNKFQKNYKTQRITKEEIFYYVYAVLHHPNYRKKYDQNLKRDFPRIPFYSDFETWKNWGKKLMELHLNFEDQALYPLEVQRDSKLKSIKPKLKADISKDIIILDEATTLSGIPSEAWDYKLGNRSALEWVLDQYKEKKSSDPTIETKFNNYKFRDYKNDVIELLKKVTTVSVETVRILNEMSNEK